MTLDITHPNGDEMIIVPRSDVSVVDEDNITEQRLQAALELISYGFLQVGFGLRAIQSGQLYRARGYNNFVAFCKEELKFGRVQATRLMQAAETSVGLSQLLMPENERQFRELRRFPVHMRGQIMAKAKEHIWRNDKKLSASIITSIGAVEVQLEHGVSDIGDEHVDLYDQLVAGQTQQRRLAHMYEDTEQVYSNVTMETILPLLAQAAIVNWLFSLWGFPTTEIKVSAYMRISD